MNEKLEAAKQISIADRETEGRQGGGREVGTQLEVCAEQGRAAVAGRVEGEEGVVHLLFTHRVTFTAS